MASASFATLGSSGTMPLVITADIHDAGFSLKFTYSGIDTTEGAAAEGIKLQFVQYNSAISDYSIIAEYIINAAALNADSADNGDDSFTYTHSVPSGGLVSTLVSQALKDVNTGIAADNANNSIVYLYRLDKDGNEMGASLTDVHFAKRIGRPNIDSVTIGFGAKLEYSELAQQDKRTVVVQFQDNSATQIPDGMSVKGELKKSNGDVIATANGTTSSKAATLLYSLDDLQYLRSGTNHSLVITANEVPVDDTLQPNTSSNTTAGIEIDTSQLLGVSLNFVTFNSSSTAAGTYTATVSYSAGTHDLIKLYVNNAFAGQGQANTNPSIDINLDFASLTAAPEGAAIVVEARILDDTDNVIASYNQPQASFAKDTEASVTGLTYGWGAGTLINMFTNKAIRAVTSGIEDGQTGTIELWLVGDNTAAKITKTGVAVANNEAEATLTVAELNGLSRGNYYGKASGFSDLAGNTATPVTGGTFLLDAGKILQVTPNWGNGDFGIDAQAASTGSVVIRSQYVDAGASFNVLLVNDLLGTATTPAGWNRAVESDITVPLPNANPGYPNLKALADGSHDLIVYHSYDDALGLGSTETFNFTKNTALPVITMNVGWGARMNEATLAGNAAGRTITFSVTEAVAGDKVTVTSGLFAVPKEVTLNGAGEGSLVLAANDAEITGKSPSSESITANFTSASGNAAQAVTHNFEIATAAPSIDSIAFGWAGDGLSAPAGERTLQTSETQTVQTSNMKTGDELKLSLSKAAPSTYAAGPFTAQVNGEGKAIFTIALAVIAEIPYDSLINVSVESNEAGGLNGYGNEVDAKAFSFNTGATAGGDPYVRTLKGELYKLDNITGVCRMLQGVVNGERLVVNTMMKLDSQSTEDEMNRWSESNKVEENESVLEKQSFYTALYVCHGESECVVDLESGEVKVNGDNKMAVEKINAENASLPMYSQERSFGGCSINAGGVKVNCMLYKNKQLRNEISVEGSSLIENADGYAIRPMRTKECRVKKLRDNRELKMKQSSYKGVVRERFYSKNDKSGKYMNISRV